MTKEARIILDGNDPKDNTYCRIAAMVLYTNEEQLGFHVNAVKEKFYKTYRFIPNIKVQTMEEYTHKLNKIDFEKSVNEFLEYFKNSYEKEKDSLKSDFIRSHSDSDVDKKKCTCGETSDYCTCNIAEVVEYKDPKNVPVVEDPIMTKINEAKSLSTELGYKLMFEPSDRKATLEKGGMTVVFRYYNLEDVLEEIVEFLENDGNL